MHSRRRNTTASTADLTSMYSQIKSDKAFIFLCLFDGLRIPTIRRLSRKPQTICFEPLNNFDPDLYSPTTTQMLIKRYQEQIHCPNVFIRVDPTFTEVDNTLKQASLSMNQRTIIHYFGQGSGKPDAFGKLFFFNNNRTQYHGIDIALILNSFYSPVTFIIDCNNAGILYQPIVTYLEKNTSKDVIAFFACQEGETLPSATNMPLDILSSSILDPLKSAIWFHGLNALNENHIYLSGDIIEESIEIDTSSEQTIAKTTKEMSELLSSILNSVALSQLPEELYAQIYGHDESLREIVNGFILATRILDYFNIHTDSYPDFPPTANAPQWCLWDIYLDGLKNESDGAKKTRRNLFKELKQTYTNFPNHSLVPIIVFFMNRSEFREEASNLIINYLEYYGNDVIPASVDSISTAIMNLKEPKEIHYIILAKLYLVGYKEKVDIKHLFYTKDQLIFKAAMLVIICSIGVSDLTNKSKILLLCGNTATKCAPYAGILFGLVASSLGMVEDPEKAFNDFLPLLNDQRDDVRASAVMAIGFTKQRKAIVPVAKLVYDKSINVAAEALYSLIQLIRFNPNDGSVDEEMKTAVHDAISYAMNSNDKVIRQTLNSLTPFVDRYIEYYGLQLPKTSTEIRMMPESRMIGILRESVLKKGFVDRYHSLFWENE